MRNHPHQPPSSTSAPATQRRLESDRNKHGQQQDSSASTTELHKSRPARSKLPYVIPQCLPSKTPARRPQRDPTLRPKHRKRRPDVIRRVHAADNDPQHLLNQYLRWQHLRSMLRASHVTVRAKKEKHLVQLPQVRKPAAEDLNDAQRCLFSRNMVQRESRAAPDW